GSSDRRMSFSITGSVVADASAFSGRIASGFSDRVDSAPTLVGSATRLVGSTLSILVASDRSTLVASAFPGLSSVEGAVEGRRKDVPAALLLAMACSLASTSSTTLLVQ